MQSPPRSTIRKYAPHAIVGGGALAAAAIVGLALIPPVSGAAAETAGPAAEVAPVTEKPALGAPRDALSPDELSYALHLATGDASLPADVSSVDGSNAPQVLSIDLGGDVDATDRLVDVVLYDYTSNATFQQTVNLSAGTVASASSTGIQPPPSVDEIDYAFRLFLDDAAASADVRAEYAAITGAELTSIDQLGVSGGSFVPDASTIGAEACAVDRCVEMQFRVARGGYLDTTGFVVDLSTRTVIGIK